MTAANFLARVRDALLRAGKRIPGWRQWFPRLFPCPWVIVAPDRHQGHRLHGSALPSPTLQRFSHNPILLPRRQHPWESRYVFNSGALYLDNRVHFVYRAVGESGQSVFGYAASRDGIQIDERADQPIYRCSQPFYAAQSGSDNPQYYESGGSSYGCEDPRLTRVGDTIYMTYTSFSGWETPPCVALTTISVEDFLARRWHWSSPVLLSPAHEMHKNWVIFPEKFHGKFAILHSITPDLQIDYVDSLTQVENGSIQSHHFRDYREHQWDSWVRGAGAPPISTPDGWLLFYQAMDARDPDRYKLGVMLLDRDRPENVLARLSYPILEPNARYENEGFKSGIIYNCGTVLIGDRLMVYYGGADSVLCGASISLHDLLEQLHSHPARQYRA
ncbi:MAG: hypothetical protein R3292_07045 [Alcanivorax sp.]|nr:hypothetical protein [Alcanivorax sp.]